MAGRISFLFFLSFFQFSHFAPKVGAIIQKIQANLAATRQIEK
jgi:hypothetical protein